jgi:hypothetical protein
VTFGASREPLAGPPFTPIAIVVPLPRSPFGAGGLAIAAALFAHSAPARACGVPPPGSPPGFRCTDGDAETAPRFRTSVNYTFSSTRIVFSGDKKADVERSLAASAFEYRASDKWALQLSAGLLLAGKMVFPDSRHDFAHGLSLAIGASYRLLEEKGVLPFVGLTGTFGYASAKTHEARTDYVGYNAFDLRLGAVAGKTIADALTIYAAARVFGGPIFWKLRGESLTGTDVYKYQIGAGASVVLWKRVDLFAEGVAFGERMLSAGLGVSY